LIVIEGPITADCFGPLVFTAGATATGGAIGAGDGLRIGSSCGLTVAGSSLRLFHTWILPPLTQRVIRHSQHLEGQVLYL